jgi:hypothetical protein
MPREAGSYRIKGIGRPYCGIEAMQVIRIVEMYNTTRNRLTIQNGSLAANGLISKSCL